MASSVSVQSILNWISYLIFVKHNLTIVNHFYCFKSFMKNVKISEYSRFQSAGHSVKSEMEMELLNLGPAVLDHKRHAYQEGRETDCKILCSDGHVMVRTLTAIYNSDIFQPIIRSKFTVKYGSLRPLFLIVQMKRKH